jgi:uncharacterized membrane protein SpoIIM required for sporulation
MKSVEFRREREASWQELEQLIAQVESGGIVSLSAQALARLPMLYRATLASLSVARAISLDRNVVEYLESLAGRAYFCVYGTKQPFLETVAHFALARFPRAVRGAARQVALAALLLVAGTATGMVLTERDNDRFYALVDDSYAGGRGPASSTEDLRAVLYQSKDPADRLTAFAMFLFTHNASVGILCFALGFAAGVPTFLLLFMNGLILGAFAALYQQRGLGWEFWAWVLPHGVTELSAVVLCAAAGLVLGECLVFPGRHTRLDAMARRGREAGVVVLGAIGMFLLAGLIEGIFRQTVGSVAVRTALAAITAAGWLAYFLVAGRRERP